MKEIWRHYFKSWERWKSPCFNVRVGAIECKIEAKGNIIGQNAKNPNVIRRQVGGCETDKTSCVVPKTLSQFTHLRGRNIVGITGQKLRLGINRCKT